MTKPDWWDLEPTDDELSAIEQEPAYELDWSE